MKHVNIVDGIVVAEFSCPQDKKEWPNIVAVEDDDPRYIEFIELPYSARLDE
ncbi:hypothetical protein [Yersinia sp. 1252 StPb PI]|uniref:hypothetical protein n=1 Tax=unclassified Yersinia (in: enterobacteria) TaxID=2653513 RepID=UPI00187D5C2E